MDIISNLEGGLNLNLNLKIENSLFDTNITSSIALK